MSEVRRPQAWVATIPPEVAQGMLKEAYDWQARRLGEPTEYTQLGSLHPELVYERLRLYKVVDGLPSSLTDAEKHIVVYLTSVLNETPHCASGPGTSSGLTVCPTTWSSGCWPIRSLHRRVTNGLTPLCSTPPR